MKMKIFRIISCILTLLLLMGIGACGSEKKNVKSAVKNEPAVATKKSADKESSSDSGKDSKDSGKDNGKESGSDGGMDKREKEVKLPEDSIILISERSNYAWGYYCSGIFIDSKGDVYSYDFSSLSCYRANHDTMSLLEKLEIVRKYDKPVATLDEETVRNIYSLGIKIDPNAGYEEEFTMCDYGQDTVYFVKEGSKEPLVVYTYGDTTRTPKDKNALELNGYFIKLDFSKAKKNLTQEDNTVIAFDDIVYIANLHDSGGDYNFIESKCKDGKGGYYKAVATNKQAVLDFVKNLQFGEDEINDFFDEIYEGIQDKMLYFIELHVEGQLGPDRNMCGMMIKDGRFSMLPVPAEIRNDGPGCDALDYYCNIIAYPADGLKISELAVDGVFAGDWKLLNELHSEE